MKMLCIDTCTNCCSATILIDGNVVSHNFLNTNKTHSETIITLIDNALKTAEINIDDIDIFGTSNGPGSFTGVRISSAIIKGLCFNDNIPCVTVSSLLSLAYNVLDIDGIIMPVLDARKNQFYTALFKCYNKKITRITKDDAIDICDISLNIKNFKENIYLVGDGAEKCFNKIKDDFLNIRLCSQNTVYNNSLGVALACFNNLDTQKSSKNICPNYIRLSQAQKDLQDKKTKNIMKNKEN